jgi:hypothetical protein
MSANPGPWEKPGMIDRLRELHARGDSFTEIADALGVSKNSVVGKVHRLDLPPRPLPAALEGVKNKPRAAAATAQVSFLPVANSAAGASRPRPQLFPVRGCQFPMWADKEKLLGEDPRFCDAPARRNEEGRQDSAYCPAHHARCFSKRRVAEDEVREKPKNRAWQGPPARGRFPAYV